jgi:hypothetical protein
LPDLLNAQVSQCMMLIAGAWPGNPVFIFSNAGSGTATVSFVTNVWLRQERQNEILQMIMKLEYLMKVDFIIRLVNNCRCELQQDPIH